MLHRHIAALQGNVKKRHKSKGDAGHASKPEQFLGFFCSFISQSHILCQVYCHLVTWSLLRFLWS